jgi:hypothetical protein
VCVNDCCAFYDFKSRKFQSKQYSQLDACPRCGADRYVSDPKTGLKKNAKVMYYMPSHLYWQYLFSQKETVSYLFNDNSPALDLKGGIRSSGGYYRKVTSNPNINCDSRNQAVVLSTDGMPFFKDMGCRSGWPVLMRSAMLPSSLWNLPAYTHMIAFQASDYLINDAEQSGELVRVKRLLMLPPNRDLFDFFLITLRA